MCVCVCVEFVLVFKHRPSKTEPDTFTHLCKLIMRDVLMAQIISDMLPWSFSFHAPPQGHGRCVSRATQRLPTVAIVQRNAFGVKRATWETERCSLTVAVVVGVAVPTDQPGGVRDPLLRPGAPVLLPVDRQLPVSAGARVPAPWVSDGATLGALVDPRLLLRDSLAQVRGGVHTGYALDAIRRCIAELAVLRRSQSIRRVHSTH